MVEILQIYITIQEFGFDILQSANSRLKHEPRSYFRRTNSPPFDYFTVYCGDKSQVITHSCAFIARHYAHVHRQEFGGADQGVVIELYTLENGNSGIWFSKHGVEYNPDVVNRVVKR